MHQGVLQHLIRSTAERLRARIAATPPPRLRRILLALYVIVAFGDAAAKGLAANAAVNRAATRFAADSATAAQLASARKPGGNFEIFRAASRHLLAGQDLYAEWPAEHVDRFKYSPTFALLFVPLSWMYWPVALFLWSALNVLVLFYALDRLLPPRPALVAQGLLLLELLRAMQNAQSNGLVAGLIIWSFLALERRRVWRAAAAIVAGASIKIFPLAALSFAIPRRRVWRTGVAAVASGAAALLLPLLVTPPLTLAAQYRSWRGVESSDARQRWFSVMELLHRWFGAAWPNWPVQLTGTLLLLAPLALRRSRWEEQRFRLLYLCSVLVYVVLFNHQAERASYAIAMTGIVIWFASEPRATWRTALLALAFVTITLMSTLIPGSPKSPTAMLYRLAGPSLLIWVAIQVELWGKQVNGTANRES